MHGLLVLGSLHVSLLCNLLGSLLAGYLGGLLAGLQSSRVLGLHGLLCLLDTRLRLPLLDSLLCLLRVVVLELLQ